MSAPGSKNLISSWPADMRSMSFENRTPDGPRCGRLLANALCIFQLTFPGACCASAPAAQNVTKREIPTAAALNDLRFAMISSPFGGFAARARRLQPAGDAWVVRASLRGLEH